MCFSLLSIYVTLAIPICGLFSSTLWYLEAKEYEFRYMAEARYLSALVSGVPGLLLALCEVGAV